MTKFVIAHPGFYVVRVWNITPNGVDVDPIIAWAIGTEAGEESVIPVTTHGKWNRDRPPVIVRPDGSVDDCGEVYKNLDDWHSDHV